jgi:uncharacterized protein
MIFIIKGLATGVIAGFICGLFGMGGGSLIVPAIVHVFSMPMKQAIGTSLFVIVFSAISALINYMRSKQIKTKLALFIVPSGMVGAQAGALLTSRLPEAAVKYIFIILVTLLGTKMLLQPEDKAACEKTDYNKVSAILIGLSAGFVSGLCGVGGAVMIVPLLYIFLKVPMHACIGTSLIAIFFNSLSGSTGYIIRGYVDFRIGTLLAVSSMIAAPLGAKLSINTPRERLRRMFAVILILSGLSILIR